MMITCTGLSCLSAPTSRAALTINLGSVDDEAPSSVVDASHWFVGRCVLLDPKPLWPYDYDMHPRGAKSTLLIQYSPNCSSAQPFQENQRPNFEISKDAHQDLASSGSRSNNAGSSLRVDKTSPTERVMRCTYFLQTGSSIEHVATNTSNTCFLG